MFTLESDGSTGGTLLCAGDMPCGLVSGLEWIATPESSVLNIRCSYPEVSIKLPGKVFAAVRRRDGKIVRVGDRTSSKTRELEIRSILRGALHTNFTVYEHVCKTGRTKGTWVRLREVIRVQFVADAPADKASLEVDIAAEGAYLGEDGSREESAFPDPFPDLVVLKDLLRGHAIVTLETRWRALGASEVIIENAYYDSELAIVLYYPSRDIYVKRRCTVDTDVSEPNLSNLFVLGRRLVKEMCEELAEMCDWVEYQGRPETTQDGPSPKTELTLGAFRKDLLKHAAGCLRRLGIDRAVDLGIDHGESLAARAKRLDLMFDDEGSTLHWRGIETPVRFFEDGPLATSVHEAVFHACERLVEQYESDEKSRSFKEDPDGPKQPETASDGTELDLDQFLEWATMTAKSCLKNRHGLSASEFEFKGSSIRWGEHSVRVGLTSLLDALMEDSVGVDLDSVRFLIEKSCEVLAREVKRADGPATASVRPDDGPKRPETTSGLPDESGNLPLISRARRYMGQALGFEVQKLELVPSIVGGRFSLLWPEKHLVIQLDMKAGAAKNLEDVVFIGCDELVELYDKQDDPAQHLPADVVHELSEYAMSYLVEEMPLLEPYIGCDEGGIRFRIDEEAAKLVWPAQDLEVLVHLAPESSNEERSIPREPYTTARLACDEFIEKARKLSAQGRIGKS